MQNWKFRCDRIWQTGTMLILVVRQLKSVELLLVYLENNKLEVKTRTFTYF
ncbi:hypothetical protein H6F61_06965 [Cyanobacteria bacterium FACHB-472]|nr:hypothetical protein [Cyanobacteria bacterium FACHB-472]